MYYIVEFAETKEIAIVPLCWLNKEKDKCRWPPFKSETKLTASMRKADAPEGAWSVCDVRCLLVFDSYEEAKRKLADAEMISNFVEKLSDEQKGNKKKRQCVRADTSDSSSESDDKLPGSVLPHSPPSASVLANELPSPVPTPCTSSTSVVESPGSTAILLSVPSAGLPSEISVVEVSVVDSPPENGEMPSSADSSTDNSIQEKVHLCSCCKLIQREVQELRVQLEIHTSLLSQLLERNKGKTDSVSVRPVLPVFIKRLLPLSSVNDLKHLNDYLADESNSAQCCRYFSTLGGNNHKDATRRILQQMISHEVSLQMNWKGRGHKQAFQNYQNVIDLIYRSVVQIPLCQLTTLADTENEIKNWLRFAADRYGGRSKRHSQVSPT